MRVMGVDPGLTRCGLSVIEGGKGRHVVALDVDVVRTPSHEPLHMRLLAISNAVEYWMDTHRPDVIAIERVFSQQNVSTVMGTAQAGGVIALAAAMQESGLENLAYGDRDSVGLFQQRPSAGWGTVAQLENPTYAAELFFGGPSNPNKGRTRGLLDIPGWQSMTVTQAAQAVQISATPNAYAKWEASARAWLAQLG